MKNPKPKKDRKPAQPGSTEIKKLGVRQLGKLSGGSQPFIPGSPEEVLE